MIVVTSADFDVRILTGAAPGRTDTRPLQVTRTLHTLPVHFAIAESRVRLAGALSGSPHPDSAPQTSAATSVAVIGVSARRTPDSVTAQRPA